MSNKPLRVVAFFSGSASSVRWLFENDPNYRVTYEFVGMFSNVSEASGIEYGETHGIPVEKIDYREWCKRHRVKRTNLVARVAYYQEVLVECIAPYNPDFILLSGHMLLLTEPFLTAYEGRMLNVHPALLSKRGADGLPKYRGIGDVVGQAMAAGDPTGSTVHILIERADLGPIVAESAPLPYEMGDNSKAHQELMKTACDGPAYQLALERLIASGWPEAPWLLE